MERHLIAYALLVALVVAATAFALYKRHHSRDRSYRRRKARETAAYEKLMADKNADSPPE